MGFCGDDFRKLACGMNETEEERESIHLEQFLKIQGWAGTGGQAKIMIQTGQVQVNGHVESRRKRQLFTGDIVTVMNESLTVQFD